jgi:hypothetical protein
MYYAVAFSFLFYFLYDRWTSRGYFTTYYYVLHSKGLVHNMIRIAGEKNHLKMYMLVHIVMTNFCNLSGVMSVNYNYQIGAILLNLLIVIWSGSGYYMYYFP